MTIDEAIIILHREIRGVEINYPDALKGALGLGIEALKRLKEHRDDHIDLTYRALPGETEK